jgi:outer membrane protein assembly factor BamB
MGEWKQKRNRGKEQTMRKLYLAGAALLLLTAVLSAQSRSTIYSNPHIPSEEVLRRLNLTVNWFRYAPNEGRRDGILTAQLIGNDLFVQTRAGTVTRLDAETGTVRWRARVGNPYMASRALAANNRSVFVANSNYLFSLNRENGAMQWRTRLPAGISAAPVVGELALYLPTSDGRLYAFTLPVTDFLASRGDSKGIGGSLAPISISGFEASGTEREGAIGPQPGSLWTVDTGLRLEYTPVQTPESILCVSPTGQASAYAKVPREGSAGVAELYRFASERPVGVPAGQFADTAYIGSQDANLYALNINTGVLRWRYTAGTAVTRQPIALEKDVYFTTEKEGLIRVDRETGEAMWRIPSGGRILESNPGADRFLAANDRFVYATDPSGRLLILDHRRGNRLSMLDTHLFHVPVPNRVTDRLYLAANDGLILCLRDRDQEKPIRHRQIEESAADPLKKKLLEQITEPGGKVDTLRNTVVGLTKKYGLKIEVVSPAFKEIGIDNVLEKEIKMPRVEKKPLSDLLALILKQVNGTYELVEDTLVVIPGKARER